MKGSCTARSGVGQPRLAYSEKLKVQRAPDHNKKPGFQEKPGWKIPSLFLSDP
jgi:hypothetical protein